MGKDRATTWLEVDKAPDEVQRAAAKAGLGSRYIEYRAGISRGLATAFKVICFGLYVFVMAAFLRYSLRDGNVYLILLFGSLLVVTAVYMCVIARALMAVGDKVYLFDSGLVHRSRAGRVRIFQWPTIAVYRDISRTVRGGQTMWVDYKFTLRRPDGQSLVVNHNMYWDIEKLGGHIENAVTHAQLPVAAEAVSGGEPVDFGRFRIDTHGITDRKGLVPWSEVDAIHMANGQVGVWRRRKRRQTKEWIRKVPNVHVFVALAQTMLLASRG
ncbi:DUF6585 family protein [Nocardia sp. GCM10030253]|uniref:DUF6585 family protein n=1 Tax=Nocardia sp. GCM10030253 TaxID=3273404 RepID=UPI00362C9995